MSLLVPFQLNNFKSSFLCCSGPMRLRSELALSLSNGAVFDSESRVKNLDSRRSLSVMNMRGGNDNM